MSNHYTTRCTVTGDPDAIEQFYALMFMPHVDEGERFDFERIFPLPDCFADQLANGVNGITNEILAILCEPIGMNVIWDHVAKFRPGMGEWPGLFNFKDRGGMAAVIEQAYPGEIAKARKSALCFGLTGYFSIFDWCYANWGTKWNSYRVQFDDRQDGRLYFRFETANGFPRPIFDELAKRFPSLKFECAYFDEGWGQAGRGFFNGSDSEPPFADEPPTNELYEIVYGEPPEHDEQTCAG